MTRNVQRPVEAPRRRGSFGALSLVPLAAAALIVAVGVVWLGGREDRPPVGASPSPATSQIVTADSPTPPPTASASPVERCTLEASIRSWEGAAGSRIATIDLRNTSRVVCEIAPVATVVRLIDGSARALAEVQNADSGARIELGAGETATTEASVANVCGAPAVPPVTIQIEFADIGTVTAKPLDATDATVPPCNGPSQPSAMSIHAWTR